tara:strand:- start:3736 stop:4554 length:819 start_codon:yes stop_codon:yes gene_type:complete
MKKIVLFDMDGTLTPARKEMPGEIAEKLFILHNSGYDIGIISGSGLNYIMEQCCILFQMYGARLDNLKIYPCNGTKYYKWNSLKSEPESQYQNSIRSELGSVKLKKVLNALLKYQIDFMNNYEFSERFNYTGTFVDYRESMINWCPIGRNTGFSDRAVFEDLDSYFKIRNKFARVLGKDSTFSGLAIRVGGATSFDIYPHGWDKTFPMNGNSVKSGMSVYDEIYFAGDKCQEGGNDHELYLHVKLLNEENVFESNGPGHTINFINDLINRTR